MKTIKCLTLLAAVAIIFNSCTKDGATGPAGPTGATGNANVQTATFSISSSEWTSPYYAWELDAVDQTANFDFSGAVECYYSTDNNTWIQLSWVSDGNAPYYEMIFAYNQTTGIIGIEWTNITSGSTSAPTPPAIAYFKIVAIPPAIMVTHPNINWNNANEVTALPEVQAALHK